MQTAKRSNAKRILLVEDDAGCLRNIATFLREEGYDVTQAQDGDEALELIARSSFDLVLTDIRMPRIDGITLAEQVRTIAPETPVILMTGFVTQNIENSALACNFISKPLLLTELLTKIAEAIRTNGASGQT